MRVSKGNYCAAIDCHVNWGANPDISLFRFPKDPDRCKKWAVNTQRKDFHNKTMEQLHKNCLLCANHFTDNQFMNITRKNRLVHDAIPTEFLNLPNKPPSLALMSTESCNRELPVQRSPTPREKEPEPVCLSITGNKNEAGPSQVSQDSIKEEDVRMKLRNVMEVIRRMRLHKDKCKPVSKEEIRLQCKQYLSGSTLEFISAQLNMVGSSKNGRRWNSDLKLLALSLYYYSPKAYRSLAVILRLPTRSTLTKWIENLEF